MVILTSKMGKQNRSVLNGGQIPLELIQQVVDSFLLVARLQSHDVLALGPWHPQLAPEQLSLL